MILGAGIYQVPLIRTARRMGLYTIVVSIPGDYPGFALADKIYELNTRDKEAILAAAEKEPVSYTHLIRRHCAASFCRRPLRLRFRPLETLLSVSLKERLLPLPCLLYTSLPRARCGHAKRFTR